MSRVGADWAARYEAICAGGALGLVHQFATHNVTVDGSLGRIYGRDDWIAALADERAGLSSDGTVPSGAWLGAPAPRQAVVLELDWKVTHAHAAPLFGPGTQRSAVLASTLVGLTEGERVYRAWRFADYAAVAETLGVALDGCARALTTGAPGRGGIPWEFGEVHLGLGQTAPPPSAPPPPGLAPPAAEPCLQLQRAWNLRRPELVASLYCEDATVLDGAKVIDRDSPRHPWARILAACPQAVLFFEYAATSPDDARVALVWRWVGNHSRAGLGPPCQRRLHARGVSTLHLRDGRIGVERVVFDELGFRKDALLRMPRAETRLPVRAEEGGS
jgi:hypothetical protein